MHCEVQQNVYVDMELYRLHVTIAGSIVVTRNTRPRRGSTRAKTRA